MNVFVKSRRFRRCLLSTGVLIAISTAYFERASILSSAGDWLDVSGPLRRPVDSVFVLGGDSRTRPFVATAILRAGLAKRVLIPDVMHSSDVVDGIVPAEDHVIREILLRADVDSSRIVNLPGTVNSTEDESRRLADYLRENPRETVAIVTTNFHTRRSRLLFYRACGDRSQNLVFVGAPTDGFDAQNWWQFEGGTVAYVSEYLKLARAVFR